MKGGRHGEREHDDSLYSSMSRQFHASTLCYAKLSQSTIVIITERPLRRIPGRRDGMWTGSKKHFFVSTTARGNDVICLTPAGGHIVGRHR